MYSLGESWRAVHALSAAVAAAATLLAADFVWRRFPQTPWRLPLTLATALLIGLNSLVIEYATIGQPYALCLLLLVVAFRISVTAAERASLAHTVLAGCLASAAAACSLLSAAAVPVLLAWAVFADQTRRRACKFFAFLAGAAIPFLPVLWWFARAPRQVLFNLVQYQLFYRRANWEDATSHDWGVLISPVLSVQALLLGALGAWGIWSCRRERRREVCLCGWLVLGIGAELCAAHPTFEWYFVLIVPFLAIAAAAGLPSACARFLPQWPPWRAVAMLSLLFAAGAAWALHRDRTTFTWRSLEAVARKVDEVTPPGDSLWADEHIYFLTRRQPAEGTEFSYAEVADVPASMAASLHIVHVDELARRAAFGKYSSVSTCEDNEQIEALELPRLFVHQATIGTCHVYWGPAARAIR